MQRQRHPLGRPIGWTPGRPARHRRPLGFGTAPLVEDVREIEPPNGTKPAR